MMKLNRKQVDLLDESIHELDLPVRVINALEAKKSVFRVKDLLQLTQNEIMAMPNFGKKTVETILARLAEHGFHQEGAGPSPKERINIVAKRRKQLQDYYTKGDGSVSTNKKS